MSPAQAPLGRDHPDLRTVRRALAPLYAYLRNCNHVALFLWPAAVFGQSPELMDAYNRANELSGEGSYQEAIPFAEEAQRLSEREFDPNDPTTATTLNNLALLYDDQGRYAEAEPLYKSALTINEKALDPDHPDVALDLNNLAGLYVDQGHYAEAEPLHKRALAINDKALGPDHPNVATSLGNLAWLYDKQGRLPEALAHIRQATAIHRSRAKAGAGKSATGALSE